MEAVGVRAKVGVLVGLKVRIGAFVSVRIGMLDNIDVSAVGTKVFVRIGSGVAVAESAWSVSVISVGTAETVWVGTNVGAGVFSTIRVVEGSAAGNSPLALVTVTDAASEPEEPTRSSLVAKGGATVGEMTRPPGGGWVTGLTWAIPGVVAGELTCGVAGNPVRIWSTTVIASSMSASGGFSVGIKGKPVSRSGRLQADSISPIIPTIPSMMIALFTRSNSTDTFLLETIYTPMAASPGHEPVNNYHSTI